MSYTNEQLAKIPTTHLVNIATFGIDSGVREYLLEVRQVKAELARRGEKIRFVRVAERRRRVACLVGK